MSEFNAATGRYQYYLADASGNKLLDGQGKPSAVNPDAMIGITRVKLDQQTSQSTTTTKPDGTQQTVISQGPAQDATLSAASGNARNPAENSLGLATDGGLATGDLVVYQSQGTAIAGLVDGQRYYVINVSENGSYRYQLATSLQNAKDGIAIQLGATSGSGGVTLRKVVDKLDSGGGMISLDIGALTQGHGLTNSMLSITVAGAGGKSLAARAPSA